MLKKVVLCAVLVLTAAAFAVPAVQACNEGESRRAVEIAKREVGADRDTHIFVAVPQGTDCDDWLVYKKTPGKYGVTACIVTITDWTVTDVECYPTGP